jgi:hypothetical protein
MGKSVGGTVSEPFRLSHANAEIHREAPGRPTPGSRTSVGHWCPDGQWESTTAASPRTSAETFRQNDRHVCRGWSGRQGPYARGIVSVTVTGLASWRRCGGGHRCGFVIRGLVASSLSRILAIFHLRVTRVRFRPPSERTPNDTNQRGHTPA